MRFWQMKDIKSSLLSFLSLRLTTFSKFNPSTDCTHNAFKAAILLIITVYNFPISQPSSDMPTADSVGYGKGNGTGK